MQLTDVLCYMVLTITVTASCVGAEEQKSEIEESQPERKISKRQATVILDNYPMDRIFQKPKVIYRRISKQRYGPPKSKYGPPKPKYRPPKVTRKPGKQNHNKKTPSKTKKHATKYGPPDYNPNKKRSSKPKPRYASPKVRQNGRPGFGHVVKMPHYSLLLPSQLGFGEPPMEYLGGHPKQSYGEPPVDSYGAPLKNIIKDVYSTPQSFQETSQHYDIHDFNRQEYQSWNHRYQKSPDTNFAFTREQQTFSVPNNGVFVTPTPKDDNDDSAEPDVPEKQIMQDNKFFFGKSRPFYFTDSKFVNRPWTPNKIDFDDEVLVGGQYAEPPARYVAKFPPHSPMYEDDNDDDIFTPLHGYVDTDVASAANNSPYSIYKNSNMAFSPQNLNDAFSIVAK